MTSSYQGISSTRGKSLGTRLPWLCVRTHSHGYDEHVNHVFMVIINGNHARMVMIILNNGYDFKHNNGHDTHAWLQIKVKFSLLSYLHALTGACSFLRPFFFHFRFRTRWRTASYAKTSLPTE